MMATLDGADQRAKPLYPFDRDTYLKLTRPRPGEAPERIYLGGLLERLEGTHGMLALAKWRRQAAAQGGYGPVALPEPDDFEERGDGRPRPWWYRTTLEPWLYQFGRRNLATGAAQKLRATGGSGGTLTSGPPRTTS